MKAQLISEKSAVDAAANKITKVPSLKSDKKKTKLKNIEQAKVIDFEELDVDNLEASILNVVDKNMPNTQRNNSEND